MGELDPNTVIGAATLILGAIGAGVLRSAGVGRRILAAIASDLERRSDGSWSAKPGGDGEALADAIATRVQERQAPELRSLREGQDRQETEIRRLREAMDTAEEREAERSRRVDRIERRSGERFARIEERLRIPPTREDAPDEDLPEASDGGRRR